MRLFVANPWGERLGGAENILFSFLRNLDRNRIEPFVVFLAEGSFEADVAALGFPTATVPTARLRRGGSALRAIRALGTLIERERPDLVLGWGPKPQVYLGPASRRAGIGDRCLWRATELPQAAVHRLAITLPAAGIVCASQFVAEAHRRLRPRRPVFVAHPGLDPVPPPSNGDVEEVRRRLAVEDGAAVVGTVGRLVPVKQQDRLLRLVAELRTRGRPAHALLVGGDVHGFAPRYEPYLRSLAAELGLDGAVSFTGQVGSVGPYIAAMDAFVSAVPDEGFGAAVLEALSLGTPVVAVDVGGPAEIVEDGDSGLLVPDSSAEALADAVEAVVTDRGLHARLAEGGRRRFERHFTAGAGAERLTGVLEEVADRDI